MSPSFVELFYLLATALFVFSLHWMNDPKTARRGVIAGASAMAIGMAATWFQPFIQNLTGINREMLKKAPKFKDISKKIMHITNNCILVAHNADFDYRVLRNEFTNIGVSFNRKTLCTIELSKELLPEQDSYSLGKLTTSLGIKIEKRHRADGDAMATLKLFKMLLEKDKTNVIDRLTK